MQYRNEVKHLITPADRAALCASMRTVAQLDPHAGEKGYYTIRSLYFDNLADKALREKLDGVNMREKFRIRYYDGDLSVIHLEKKVKRDGVGYKVSCPVTREEVQRLLDGDLSWMPASGRALVVELYAKMKGQGLRPNTIVDYERIPFVYAPGNVRVTIDYNIRFARVYPLAVNSQQAASGTGHSMQALNSLSQPHGADLNFARVYPLTQAASGTGHSMQALNSLSQPHGADLNFARVYPLAVSSQQAASGTGLTAFLDPNCVTLPAGNQIILEVKWDDYLPTIIRHAVQLKGRRASAFSKYSACRIYG